MYDNLQSFDHMGAVRQTNIQTHRSGACAQLVFGRLWACAWLKNHYTVVSTDSTACLSYSSIYHFSWVIFSLNNSGVGLSIFTI